MLPTKTVPVPPSPWEFEQTLRTSPCPKRTGSSCLPLPRHIPRLGCLRPRGTRLGPENFRGRGGDHPCYMFHDPCWIEPNCSASHYKLDNVQPLTYYIQISHISACSPPVLKSPYHFEAMEADECSDPVPKTCHGVTSMYSRQEVGYREGDAKPIQAFTICLSPMLAALMCSRVQGSPAIRPRGTLRRAQSAARLCWKRQRNSGPQDSPGRTGRSHKNRITRLQRLYHRERWLSVRAAL
jgi:hypothetical protein